MYRTGQVFFGLTVTTEDIAVPVFAIRSNGKWGYRMREDAAAFPGLGQD
jgi:hypothetical protein